MAWRVSNELQHVYRQYDIVRCSCDRGSLLDAGRLYRDPVIFAPDLCHRGPWINPLDAPAMCAEMRKHMSGTTACIKDAGRLAGGQNGVAHLLSRSHDVAVEAGDRR